jgi:hypothetical protein
VVSNTGMRRIVLSLGFLMAAVFLWAQPPTSKKIEKAAIRRAKSAMVSTFDRGLPKVTLEFFLNYEAAGATVPWGVADCGEQSGDPAIDRGRDFPMCVEAYFVVKGGISVGVVVAVGTLKKGLSGTPELSSVTVSDSRGGFRTVRQLGDLPKELHRPLPRQPLDIEISVG